MLAVFDHRIAVGDRPQHRNRRQQIRGIANVDSRPGQRRAFDSDLAGLAVPLDCGAHRIEDVDDRAVALGARLGSLDDELFAILGCNRARREQIRDRRKVARDVVLAAVGAVRLAALNDEPLCARRANPVRPSRADRLGRNAEVVEDFKSDVDVGRGFELGCQIQLYSRLGDRTSHQQRGDIL